MALVLVLLVAQEPGPVLLPQAMSVRSWHGMRRRDDHRSVGCMPHT
jgi:hypothetical protein